MDTSPNEPQYTALLVLVSCTLLVDTLFYSALTPLLPHYVRVDGLSKSDVGFLVAGYPAGTMLGAIPSGALVNRIGARHTMVAGLVLMSTSTLVFGFTGQTSVLYAARFLQGIGGACTWSGTFSWLAMGTRATKQGQAIGVAYGASGAGALLGPLLGALAVHIGTAWTFSGAAVCGILLMLGSMLIRPTVVTAVTAGPALFGKWWKVLRHRGLRTGVVLTALSGLGFGVSQSLAPLRLSSLGESPNAIALAFLGAAALQTALSPVFGRLSDRLGRAPVVTISLAAGMVVCVLEPIVGTGLGLILVVALGVPMFSVLFVVATAMLSDRTKAGELSPGFTFSLSNLAWALGQVVASGAGGVLAEASNDVVPFVVIAGFMALALFAVSCQPTRAQLR